MKKSATKKAVVAAVPKEIVFPLTGIFHIRLLCRRGTCDGYMDFVNPTDLAGYAAPTVHCPKCNGEFSSGMKGSVAGDKAKLIGQIMMSLAGGTWCNTFGVELRRNYQP